MNGVRRRKRTKRDLGFFRKVFNGNISYYEYVCWLEWWATCGETFSRGTFNQDVVSWLSCYYLNRSWFCLRSRPKKPSNTFTWKENRVRTITEKFQWSETKNPSVGGNFGLICRPSNCWVSRRLRPKTQDPSKTKTPRKKLSFRGVLKKKKKKLVFEGS